MLRVLLFGLSLLAALPTSATEFVFQHEHVLGSSLELRVEAPTIHAARQAERAALDEIDRLAKVLSRHDRGSELVRWQQPSFRGTLSDDLQSVLLRADHWRRKTAGAFDPRAGALTQLWRQASLRGVAPSLAQRRALVEQLASKPFTLSDGHLERLDTMELSLDALGKGYILDAAAQAAAASTNEVAGVTVNIGGDLRHVGAGGETVHIVDPLRPFEGAKPLQTVELDGSFAMATSGTYRRFVGEGTDRVPHIFDPRSGLPVADVVSATVLASNAMDADAIATALSVLTAAEGLALVEPLQQTEALVQLASGQVLATSGWPSKPVSPSREPSATNDEAKAPGLYVDFTVNRPKSKGSYRRPYLAVWLEDSDGFPVKTAVLWMQTEDPGPRWHRDLLRWYRNDRMRKLAGEPELIGSISGATRGPGEYKAFFDGTDTLGNALPPGEYTLCLEAAREHGTYQIIRSKVTLGEDALKRTELEGNIEISAASYEYVPPSASATRVR
ncbi:MAG: DUF2271 domain-containing protein [Acidobacteriota bacterium]